MNIDEDYGFMKLVSKVDCFTIR